MIVINEVRHMDINVSQKTADKNANQIEVKCINFNELKFSKATFKLGSPRASAFGGFFWDRSRTRLTCILQVLTVMLMLCVDVAIEINVFPPGIDVEIGLTLMSMLTIGVN